jgi:ABC-2 type transport system permease protein
MFKSVVIAFLSGQLIPITFFPDSFARVLKILPFSYTNFYPIYMFMGKLSSKEVVVALFIQLVWAVVLLISMKKLYTKALLRLQIGWR